MIEVKNQSLKKFICLLLSCCFLVLAGCSDTTPAGSDGDTTTSSEDTTAKITASNTTSTTTTTTTKGSTTVPSNPTQPSSAPTGESNGEKLIALTFDDGPHSTVTGRILDTLERYDAKATFFIVGNRAADYPAVIRRAKNLGCEIGSHTWSHKNLTKLSIDQMNTEMNNSVNAISSITGVSVNIMRPPEGAFNSTVKSNMPYPMIMWSVDSMDWKYRDAQKDYNEVMNYVFDGAIILMHDLYPATAAAVERLVPDLIAKGYKFVTVSELMASRGVTMADGNVYYSAKP